jgi:predicted TIM-barrel fold metal-dependent hydrolase
MMELGADRILFAVDWPFNSNKEGVAFIQNACDAGAQMTGHGDSHLAP